MKNRTIETNMWLVEGAFDQPGTANLEQKKLKLLRPGKTYPLGRKQKYPLQLVLSHPKISGEHFTFIVEGHPINSVNDPTFRPTLKAVNHRNKPLQISRTVNGSVIRHLLQPSSEGEILPEDCIALVTGIYITIHWHPICCFLPPKSPSISFEKCASLGVKVVSAPRTQVTHHLTASLDVSAPIAASLLSCAHVVRPEWLSELLHLGETKTSADGPSVLEADFRLPAIEQYRPESTVVLPAQFRSSSIWEPSERRTGMLKGWRFLFVGERGREVDTETRAIVDRGGGEYEVFDVSGGLTRWKQSLGRNRRKATEGGNGMSIIGDTETLKIAAGDVWDGMLEELSKAGLCFVSRTQLIEAVLFIDTSRINSSMTVQTEQGESPNLCGKFMQADSVLESPLPDRIPNTHEDESSRLPSTPEVPISAANAARTGNHLADGSVSADSIEVPNGVLSQVEPAKELGEQEQQPSRESQEPDAKNGRRRPLVRRARTNATQAQDILGVDDPSFASFTVPTTSAIAPEDGASSTAGPPESQGVEKPTSSQAPPGRPSRLKKRVRPDKDYNPILASLEEEIAAATGETSHQPPLKRFKVLFDETDPDRVPSQMTNGMSGGILDSQLFSQSDTGDVNGECNEIRRPNTRLSDIHEEEEASQSLPAKNAPTHQNVQMETDEPPQPSQPKPPSKVKGSTQTRTGPFDSTQLNKRAGSKGGAAPGKPDTDAAFLQALASTKKGKRKEDDFDREFNNLRISKPELQREAEADDWRVLADFGEDNNIRGNFMVIVEMEVPEKQKNPSRQSSSAPEKGPDFKKFKKKSELRQRPAVELVPADENDYGMGPAYWKGPQSQHESQGATQNEFPQQGYLQPSQTQNREVLQPKAGPSSQVVKPRSQNQTQTQDEVTKTRTQEAPRRPKSRRTQIIDDNKYEEGSKATPPPTSKNARTVANGKGKKGNTPLFLSDEEDEGGAHRGSHLKLKDDDDEDFDLQLEDLDLSDEEPAVPTLHSTGQSSLDTATTTKKAASPAKQRAPLNKRGAALLDDDSDTGVAFKGFGGRKRPRAR